MGPTSGSGATSTSGEEQLATEDEMMMNIPEGQGLVVFENFTFHDLVFDLSGPTPDSLVVPPGATPGQSHRLCRLTTQAEKICLIR